MPLLIGFVSKWCAPELCLGVYDPSSRRFAWLATADFLDLSRETFGINGICRFRDHWVVGFFSTPTRFAVLDKQFRVRSTFEVPQIKDVHSFCHYENDLLTVSTGTDEVLRLKFGPDLEYTGVETFYRLSEGGTDLHHLNSVAAVSDARILVTQFGRKQPGGWVATRKGRLMELPSGRVLLEPLHHPHTAYVTDGRWLVCESGTGKLHSEDGEVLDLGGYVRGLAHDSEKFYVAVSGRRLKSRSEGTTNMEPGNDPTAATCGIHVCARNPMARESFHDLSLFAREIFELIALTDEETPQSVFAVDPKDLQVRSMQDQVLRLQDQVTHLMSKNEDKGWKHDVKRLVTKRIVTPTLKRVRELTAGVESSSEPGQPTRGAKTR